MPTLTQKKQWTDAGLLMLIWLGVGTYLVATTVVISSDAVVYIERAQQLATGAEKVFNLNEPPGLPFLIRGFHGIVSLFMTADTLEGWILAGQLVTLTCTTAAVVILYFLGQTLVGTRHAFWGVLILILLPYPARFGADILRDWPHLLFLSAGLLLLYKAVERPNAFFFLGAGLVSGLGYVIRFECAQVVVYGAVFFVLRFAGAARHRQPVLKLWRYALLAAGFLFIFLLLASEQKNAIPNKIDTLINESSDQTSADKNVNAALLQTIAANGVGGLVEATGSILQGLCENLMYYFAVPAAIGFWFFLRSRKSDARLLVCLIVGFYAAALTILEMRWGYVSRRHLLPLTALACFFIPAGIEWIAGRLFGKQQAKGYYALIMIGLVVCMPKLLKPLGQDKQPYLEVSRWLKEHTPPTAVLCSFDTRIPFYAERPYSVYRQRWNARRATRANFWIVLSKDGQLPFTAEPQMQVEKRFELGGGKEILIFSR